MATELFIPKLGQTVEEVTIVNWLVEDGSKVNFGDAVLEVETDKAIFPVEANAKGILHIGPFTEGQVIPVLTVVAIIGKPEDTFPSTPPPGISLSETQENTSPQLSQTLNNLVEPLSEGKIFASPRARKTAREKQVNIESVTPTGGEGTRIIEKDILRWIETHQSATIKPVATPVAANIAATEGIDLTSISGTGPGGRILKKDIIQAGSQLPPEHLAEMENIIRTPLRGIRAIIAERMAQSVHTTARVTMFMEIDATAFVEMRERVKEKIKLHWGFTPGINDFLIKIASFALLKHPYMNARLTTDGIEMLANTNIGLAVDTDRGLLVPVIPYVNKKDLHTIATELREKIERVRSGHALPDDLTGGTFTITNLGMYDIEGFTPVINLPEAAILGVGKIIPKPVVKDDQITIRKMMTISLAFDHRIVDGAPAARFMQTLREYIEEPYLIITE